jgi:hypothetical protein
MEWMGVFYWQIEIIVRGVDLSYEHINQSIAILPNHVFARTDLAIG